jgi:hypothetical protein
MPARKSARKKKKPNPIPVPPAGDWRFTDLEEIHRRTQRASDEKHSITNLHPENPVFSTFAIASPSGMSYQVEIRDLAERSFSCICPDFRRNGLGTCKHTEVALIWLKRRLKGEFRAAEKSGSDRADLVAGRHPEHSPSTHSIPTSARACSTSHSASAPSSAMKWVSAKPSNPSLPALCSTISEKPSASSSSPPHL